MTREDRSAELVRAGLEEQLAGLQRGTRARARRLIAWRGTMPAFAASEGMSITYAYQMFSRLYRRGGALAEALDHARNLNSGLDEADLVPCRACGLRGHVAREPGRCLTAGSLRLGGSQWEGQ